MPSQRIVGALAALSLSISTPLLAQGGPGGMPPTAVETSVAQTQPLDTVVEVIGNLRADEAVTLRPEIAGRIEKILFTEGTRVEASTPLFQLDDRLIQADLHEAEANADRSQRAFDRAQDLIKRKLTSQSDFDAAKATLAVDRAKLASARTRLSKSLIRAPFSGMLGLRQVSEGEYVAVGAALVDLVADDPIKLDIAVPETYLSRLAKGQAVDMHLDAYPEQKFHGEVYALSPSIDLATRSVAMRATVANPDGLLRPGQFASVSLVLAHDPAALMIPEQSLWPLGDKVYVYRVVDGKAEQVEVKTGQRRPGEVQILSGLNAGDTVITAGQLKIGPGSPVRPLGDDPGAAK